MNASNILVRTEKFLSCNSSNNLLPSVTGKWASFSLFRIHWFHFSRKASRFHKVSTQHSSRSNKMPHTCRPACRSFGSETSCVWISGQTDPWRDTIHRSIQWNQWLNIYYLNPDEDTVDNRRPRLIRLNNNMQNEEKNRWMVHCIVHDDNANSKPSLAGLKIFKKFFFKWKSPQAILFK